ncbi:MAG: AMP-binding protein [Candidatus Binatia bacterium]
MAVSFDDADAAAAHGMSVAWIAECDPDRTALLSRNGDRTFAELNARANRLVGAFRAAGLERGDRVALLCSNRPEFAETYFAVHRGGLVLTPVNWHMTPEEIAYVVEDSGARALVAESRLAGEAVAAAVACEAAGRSVLKLAVGGPIAGFDPYEDALAACSASDIEDPMLGDTMLYTSGTTGKPKGVRRPPPEPAKAVEGWKLVAAVFDFRDDGNDIALATGPLYHSGPINLCLAIPVNNGIPTILMDRWNAAAMLELIDRHRVTHTFCVPTMFHRLLALPEEIRSSRDVSSLRFIIHGAAPCPVEDKRAVIEWFGPIVTEIYAATEGMGTIVTSQEWLEKPGTVGRPAPGSVRIVDEKGASLAEPGAVGTVFIQPAAGADFEYHGAPDKTAGATRDGYFTVGDMGYLDEDGYLFLTGRSSELIITGGTNVYPAEIDETLLGHARVLDAAAFGLPDPEWGEVVAAAVVIAPEGEGGSAGAGELESELLAYYRERLPAYKAPKVIHFVEEIPRSEAGKIYRRKLGQRSV